METIIFIYFAFFSIIFLVQLIINSIAIFTLNMDLIKLLLRLLN